MVDTRQHFGLRRTITPQLVCNESTRDIAQGFQQPAEEFLGRFLISVALDQDVQYVASLDLLPAISNERVH